MKILTINFLFLLLLAGNVNATPIVIEPDNYAEGTDLSDISPYVSLTTVGGAAVYSSTVDNSRALAAGGADTGPLGERVFSTSPTENSEWFYWRGMSEENGLYIDFSESVSFFSLTFAELFYDAGCCTDDPVAISIFDVNDELIDFMWGTSDSFVRYLGSTDESDEAWPVFEFSYSGENIGSVIVGGESEPTTIDRLSFILSADLPDPRSYLLGLVLVSFIFVNRANHKVRPAELR